MTDQERIKQWLSNSVDFDEGKNLYEKYGNDKTLLMLLSLKPVTQMVKLKLYEAIKNLQIVEKAAIKPEPKEKPEEKTSAVKPELIESYRKERNNYLREADELKGQLRNVKGESVEEIEFRRVNAFRLLDLWQRIHDLNYALDMYQEKKVIPDFLRTDDYSELTIEELKNKRQLLYVVKSKARRADDENKVHATDQKIHIINELIRQREIKETRK